MAGLVFEQKGAVMNTHPTESPEVYEPCLDGNYRTRPPREDYDREIDALENCPPTLFLRECEASDEC